MKSHKIKLYKLITVVCFSSPNNFPPQFLFVFQFFFPREEKWNWMKSWFKLFNFISIKFSFNNEKKKLFHLPLKPFITYSVGEMEKYTIADLQGLWENSLAWKGKFSVEYKRRQSFKNVELGMKLFIRVKWSYYSNTKL